MQDNAGQACTTGQGIRKDLESQHRTRNRVRRARHSLQVHNFRGCQEINNQDKKHLDVIVFKKSKLMPKIHDEKKSEL